MGVHPTTAPGIHTQSPIKSQPNSHQIAGTFRTAGVSQKSKSRPNNKTVQHNQKDETGEHRQEIWSVWR